MASPALSSAEEDFKFESMPSDRAQYPWPQNAIPMESSRDHVQSDAGVDEWEEFNKWKQQRGGMQATSTPRPIERAFVPEPQYTEHARFFLPATNIFFLVRIPLHCSWNTFLNLHQVTNTLYSIPRAPFEWHSDAFNGKGLSREDPLNVQGVDLAHFDHFLSILYPS